MEMNDNCVAEVDSPTDSQELCDPAPPRPCPSVEGLNRLTEVWARPQRWAWEGLIPLGKLTFVTGESGVGKSWFALQAAAMATRGLLTPDP